MYWLTVIRTNLSKICSTKHASSFESSHYFFLSHFSCLFLVIAPFFSDATESLDEVSILLTGFPVYWFFIYLPEEKRPEVISTMNRACTEFCQKLYPVVTTEASRNFVAIPYEVP